MANLIKFGQVESFLASHFETIIQHFEHWKFLPNNLLDSPLTDVHRTNYWFDRLNGKVWSSKTKMMDLLASEFEHSKVPNGRLGLRLPRLTSLIVAFYERLIQATITQFEPKLGPDAILTLQSDWLETVTKLVSSVVRTNKLLPSNMTITLDTINKALLSAKSVNETQIDPESVRLLEQQNELLKLKYRFDFRTMMTDLHKRYF